MGILEIRCFDDPVLRKKAKAVGKVNKNVRKILDDMLETMRAAPGVGLAAPQVGISRRLIVVDIGEEPYFLVNPELVSVSKETEVQWEGCLSWPGYIGEVERPLSVTVKGLNRDGHEVWIDAHGFLARVFAHEFDHLDGIIYVDKALSIREVTEEETDEVIDDETGVKEKESIEQAKPVTVVFMGSPWFSVPSLEALVQLGLEVRLVITRPDKPYGRRGVPKPTPVKEAAVRLGLEVMTPGSLKEKEAQLKIKEISPDFIIVSAFGEYLPKDILDIPKVACLNVHPSLLPKYRGENPVQRAVMNGEKITGVTIMYMSSRMDAGDICIQKAVDIGPNETYGTLEKRLSVIGSHLLSRAIELLCRGIAPRIKQDEAKATMAPRLRPGEEIIDWRKDAGTIHNQIRGLSPEPGAVTKLGQERIKVLESLIYQGESSNQVPGTILRSEDEMGIVQCGQGLLAVKCVQPEGKREMTCKALMLGRRHVTMKFG